MNLMFIMLKFIVKADGMPLQSYVLALALC